MCKKLFSLVLVLIVAGSLVAADVCFAQGDQVGETAGGSDNTAPEKPTGEGETAPGGGTSTPALFEVAPPPRAGGGTSKIALVQNLPGGSWEELMAKVINLVLGVVGSLAFASFTYGGVMMVTAQGNDEQIRKGKNILYWSILALVIIAASYGIVVGITQLRFFQ